LPSPMGEKTPKKVQKMNLNVTLRGLHFKVTIHYSVFKISTNSEFQDACIFAIFNKEKRKTELCIRLTKDEKGKGDNPQDR